MKLRPWMLLAGTCILGVLLGLAWPPPRLPPAPKNQDNAWNPPTAGMLSRFSEQDLQVANQGMRWFGDRSATNETTWRFAGIVNSPQPTALILTTSSASALNLNVGDTLPDGSLLTHIEKDAIIVEQRNSGQACKLTYRLHRQKPSDASSECAGASADTAQGNRS